MKRCLCVFNTVVRLKFINMSADIFYKIAKERGKIVVGHIEGIKVIPFGMFDIVIHIINDKGLKYRTVDLICLHKIDK